jgi:phosphate transport system substrate-binding protein
MSKLLPRLHRTVCGSVALTCALLAAASVGAETVTLRALDGQFVLTGKIAQTSDGVYVIRGSLGELRIDAGRVTCEGSACPSGEIAAATTPELTEEPTVLAAAADVDPVVDNAPAEVPAVAAKATAPDLAASLLAGFASSVDATAAVDPAPGIGQSLTLGDGTIVLASGNDALAALGSGAASFAIKAGPVPAMGDLGKLKSDVVAFDALVVLAHPSNPVGQLTLAQLRDIYAGRVTNWADLGGPDSPIRVIPLGNDVTSRDALEAALFAGAEVVRAAAQSKTDVTDPAATVAADPTAIAFVPQSMQAGARVIDVVDACGLVSSPDMASLKSGAYPLQVPVSLVSLAEDTTPAVSTFRDHALSAAADMVYAEAGLIDRAILRGPVGDLLGASAEKPTSPRMARLADELVAAAASHDRLTTTFRFAFGSSSLESDADSDLARLVDHLSGLPKGARVLVAGFSDDVGTSQTNRFMSTQRALTVAETLRTIGGARLDGIELASAGYGDLAPVGCNMDEAGRAFNRRVEIWIGTSAN